MLTAACNAGSPLRFLEQLYGVSTVTFTTSVHSAGDQLLRKITLVFPATCTEGSSNFHRAALSAANCRVRRCAIFSSTEYEIESIEI